MSHTGNKLPEPRLYHDMRRSHVTRMNQSCHTNEWVMSYMWISHVTHWLLTTWRTEFPWNMNESCHTYGWVTSHKWMSHVTYKWVMSHIGTYLNHGSLMTYEWIMSHFGSYSQSHLGWQSRMLFQNSKLKARTSLFTETWQKRRSSIELWASKMSPQVGLAVHESWPFKDIWMSHGTQMNEPCHTHKWVMSHIGNYLNHGFSITYEWVMSHTGNYRLHGSSMTYEWVMSHIWMSHVTHR